MEMIVFWTDSAIEDLQKIYSYLSTVASDKIAINTTNSIVERTISLEHNPRIGQIEELLKHYKKEIRYIVEGHHKIVYLIDDYYVIILTVFDCRQDPKKLEDSVQL